MTSSAMREVRSPPVSILGTRFLSSAPERETIADGDRQQQQLDPKLLANVYNIRRASYKRAVTALRKKYATDIRVRREAEERRSAVEAAKKKREVLKRRRKRAERSALNAARRKEEIAARKVEWDAELALTQIERDAKKDLYRRARQRIVDELEAEAHLWLTTPEEVEAALGNPRAGQQLWARPGGLIGAPPGPDTAFGDDGDLWRYECHTWDMRPTYKTPREVMFEELEDAAYAQANINPAYWTEERTKETEQREMKAQLRAMVREEGRKALVQKQRDMMRDVYGDADNQGRAANVDKQTGKKLPPTVMPAPKLDYLADYEAQEKEGYKILMSDPRKFFVFESDLKKGDGSGPGDDAADANDIGSLGRPVALRNPFLGDSPTPFPVILGREPEVDPRTEREKKREEREERMLAAAAEANLEAKQGMEFEVAKAAEEDLDDGSDPIDYDTTEQDVDTDLFASITKDLTDEERKDFENTPPNQRFTEDDVNWMIDKLQEKSEQISEGIKFESNMRRKELDALKLREAETGETRMIDTIDDVDEHMLADLGHDMGAMEALVAQLTPEQAMEMEGLDFSGREGVTMEDVAAALREVPGLSEEQVLAFAEMEMSLLSDKALSNIG